MKYDFRCIDDHGTDGHIYRLQINMTHPGLAKFNATDVSDVRNDLQRSLASLMDDNLTFDAETLLPDTWLHDKRSKHNRTYGLILRSFVNNNMVPLTIEPKGSGSRVRFRIRY